MKNFFYNISGGEIKNIYISGAAAVLDGITKLIPAAILINMFSVLFDYYSNPSSSLDYQKLIIFSVVLLAWQIVQYLTYSNLYDKSYVVAYEVAAKGRLSLADHVRKLSLGYFGRTEAKDLSNMILTDYALVENTVSHHIPSLIGSVILPTIAFISLSFLDWRMSLSMFIALPFGVLLLALTNSAQGRLSKKHVESKNRASNRLEEYLDGIKEIKAYNIGGEKFETMRYAFDEFRKESISLEAKMGPLVMICMLFIRSGLSIMIFVGSYLLVGGTLTLPTFLMFLLIAIKIFEPLAVLLMNYGAIRYSAYSAQRIMDVKDEKIQEGDNEVVKHVPIIFENVTFGYNPGVNILHNISFKIQPKTITALVGPSGSGKSTITRLLARFYEIEEGKIMLYNTNINTINPDSLLSDISVVFQDVYLFNDTVLNNIKIGDQEATQEEVEIAAKKACCHNFIEKLPLGYETMVGEGGSTLSQGEKQRISIARALLKDASIVLLDEATSSLDPENENEVQNAINELVKDRTVIIIAHRLKTIQDADNIIVIDEGKLVEQGDHTKLLSNDKLYAKLWYLQENTTGWQIK